MRSWLKLAVLAAAAIAVSELWLRGGGGPQLAGGEPAPEFSLRDGEGRAITLASLRGKVVALNFWATWCGPCRDEIPELSQVYAEHRGPCFELLGVAAESGPRDAVLAAAGKLGANYPILVDEDGKAIDAFRIQAYPRTFVLDAEGRVRKVFQGAIGRDELQQVVRPLLREAPGCPRT
jgi:cytochrome c biogenesis protein CcmG/thiol:disulfide interchange protein DsbE